jgi:hypothetical protein
MACTKDMAQSARGMNLNNIGVVQLWVGCGSSGWIRGIEEAFIQFEAKVLCHSVVHRASDGAHGRPFSSRSLGVYGIGASVSWGNVFSMESLKEASP